MLPIYLKGFENQFKFCCFVSLFSWPLCLRLPKPLVLLLAYQFFSKTQHRFSISTYWDWFELVDIVSSSDGRERWCLLLHKFRVELNWWLMNHDLKTQSFYPSILFDALCLPRHSSKRISLAVRNRNIKLNSASQKSSINRTSPDKKGARRAAARADTGYASHFRLHLWTSIM